MKLRDKTIVITGGASGIGAALSRKFSKEGGNVAIADLHETKAKEMAEEIGGLGLACDVTKEEDIQTLVKKTEAHFGPIDMFCSNAGLYLEEPDHSASASNKVWQKCWDIHVMAHVYAARALLPSMIERGEGYFLNTVSAAGLLSQIGDAAYSATKHAALGFAESLSITHGKQGIRVSVICPQYIATPMIGYEDKPTDAGDVMTPDQLADAVVKGVEEETFLILPHPEVADYLQFKVANYDRWLGGMRKLRGKILDEVGSTDMAAMHKLV